MRKFTPEQVEGMFYVIMSAADDGKDPNRDVIMAGLKAISENPALLQAGADAINMSLEDDPCQ